MGELVFRLVVYPSVARCSLVLLDREGNLSHYYHKSYSQCVIVTLHITTSTKVNVQAQAVSLTARAHRRAESTTPVTLNDQTLVTEQSDGGQNGIGSPLSRNLSLDYGLGIGAKLASWFLPTAHTRCVDADVFEPPSLYVIPPSFSDASFFLIK